MITARRRARPCRTVTAPMPGTPPVSAQVARLRVLLREFSSRAPITLPPVSLAESTDESIGLPHNPHAQAKAEEFLKAAIGYRLREEAQRAKAEAAMRVAFAVDHRTVTVSVPDASMTLVRPTDELTEVEAGIVREFLRLATLPTQYQPSA